MLKHTYLALLLAFGCLSWQPQPQNTTTATIPEQQQTKPLYYYPGLGDDWEKKSPEEVGMDGAKLQEAVEWAKQQETTQMEKDFSTQKEIFGEPLGPLPATRATTNGIILKDGYIVAEWGDTKAADPTYSVAKSFLSTILGLTLDKGVIQSINDPVAKYVQDGGYESAHNSKVTWAHHAHQTSEWEGELWGKKHDFIGKEAFGRGERKPRELQAPGTFYEYNDTRINRFALSLLRVWEKPLPQVLKDEIMNPIGASQTWQWVPYRNSVATVNGQQMPSVSGGTRWGGGLWISTRDEARFGYLFLRNGRWKDKQLVSEEWVKEATSPGPIKGDYGYLWWLNPEGKAWPDAPTTSYAALGAGQNTVWVDPEHDIVIVWRWHDGKQNELFKRVLEAVK
ncbi:serine hydrolase domain-containing protein [Pontibacter chinhatensis]|uniref:CubicO group peptidase, beta-lactamase class C family n=1 Tax=Pontibacter chinhatensis TaxID=1436961 RepID=A0A1I2YF06_9BACT|nr:serine hydrolase [Pontibacter chinhatensis]SFH24155.1 CubicO group peptidase, beta-lactamase class C family [Pontibacter chinhatensis]